MVANLAGAFPRTMGSMPTYSAGRRTQRRILAELRRRETLHLPPPTWAELAVVIEKRETVTRYHVRRLADAGLVTYEAGKPRTLVLTAAGRSE